MTLPNEAAAGELNRVVGDEDRLAQETGSIRRRLDKVEQLSTALDQYGVELIGARLPAIQAAEDRKLFQQTMNAAGLPTPRADIVHTVGEAQKLVVPTAA